jgi:hypothetical protein
MLKSAPRKVVYKQENKALPNFSQDKNSGIPKYVGLVDRIQEILGAKNQNEVADMLEVKPSSVSGWKKEGFVSVDTLLKVAKLSNASINWLLTGEGAKLISNAQPIQSVEPQKPSDALSLKIQTLLEDCANLNAQDKDLVLHHIEILHHEVKQYLERNKIQQAQSVLLENEIDMPDLIDRLRIDHPEIKAKIIYRVINNLELDDIDLEIISIVRKYARLPEGGDNSHSQAVKEGNIARQRLLRDRAE